MTKYTIYPCTDKTWVKVFRRIRRIARQTGMFIQSIDSIPSILPPYTTTPINPFGNQVKRQIKSILILNITTIITLEKKEQK